MTLRASSSVEMKSLRHAIDDRWYKACHHRFRASQSNLADSRVGQELDVTHALLQLVKHYVPTIEKRASIDSGLHTSLAAIEKPDGRVVNLPGLTVSVSGMLESLGRVAGTDAVRRVRFVADERIADIVGGWPARFVTAAALRLGFGADTDFDSVVFQYSSQS